MFTHIEKKLLLRQQIEHKQQEILALQNQLLQENDLPPDILLISDLTKQNLLTEWIDYLSDCVMISDVYGRYVYVNQTAAIKTGYSKQELLTMSVQDIEVKFTRENDWEERLAILPCEFYFNVLY